MIQTFLIGLAFGITQKISDAQNEHGLILGRYIYLVSSLLFGFFGILLVQRSEYLLYTILTLIIYWLIKSKIDYWNHGLSISIILIGIMYEISYYLHFNYNLVILLLIIYLVIDYMKKYALKIFPFSLIYRNKLHFLIPPLILTFMTGDSLIITGITGNMVGIIGTELILKRHTSYT